MNIDPKTDLIKEIDHTLDKLIANAEVLKELSSPFLFLEEASLLRRTQDKLLAHLRTIESLLHSSGNSHPYKEKMHLFEDLHSEIVLKVHQAWRGLKIQQGSGSRAPSLQLEEGQHPRAAYNKEPGNL